jgi:hypothetical protein
MNVSTRIVRKCVYRFTVSAKTRSIRVLSVEHYGIVGGRRSSENMDFAVCEDVSYMLISSPCFQVVPNFSDVAC